jgi:hypothetical protein
VHGKIRSWVIASVGLLAVTTRAGAVVAQPAAPPAPETTVAAPDPTAAPAEPVAPAPLSPAPDPSSEPWPPPAPPLIRLIPRYGDQGTSEIAVGLGYSSSSGFLAAGGFRYFVVDGVAPGFEGTYVRGGATAGSYGLALASLRVVPVRTSSIALVLTARAGRVFLADHDDGWGAGLGAGVIISLGRGAGLELGYEFLRLLPASFCGDLSTCVLQGPVLGIRFTL